VRVLNPARAGFRPGKVVQFSQGHLAPAGGGRGAGEPDEFQGLTASPAGVALTWSQLGLDGVAHLEYRRIGLKSFAPPPKRHKRHRRHPHPKQEK
jgi:hypothetical protein